MPTARVVIASALKLLGVLDPVETPSAEDAAEGLVCLQDLIAAWATERLTIYTTPRSLFTLAANTASFTIGSGATLSTPRPLWIDDAAYVSGSGPTATEIPLAVYSDVEWRAIPQKATTSPTPVGVYYDHGFSALGYGTLALYPVPTTVTTLVLYLPTAIVGPATLDTVLTYPPGYAKALRYALALELAPVFGTAPSPVIVEVARTSKGDVKRANTRPVELTLDRTLIGAPAFDIWVG